MKIRTFVRSEKGFSLVELMVVVSIIGILAAIAIPNFQKFTAKAKQAEAKANLAALYSAERAFMAEWTIAATGFTTIGYAPTGWVRYNHGFSTTYAVQPSGYTGTFSNAEGVVSNTYCGNNGAMNARGCGTVVTPAVPAAVPGTGITAPALTFVAGASAAIGGTAQDQWTMNNNKQLQNSQNGLP